MPPWHWHSYPAQCFILGKENTIYREFDVIGYRLMLNNQ